MGSVLELVEGVTEVEYASGVRVVIDRGTQFGVRIGESGVAEVHVFQGEVETQTRGPDEAPRVRKTLTTTQAAQFNARGRFAGWLDPDYEGFAGVGHHAYGVVRMDRAMRWLPQAPPVLEEGELQSASDMFLFLEHRDVLLERDIEITSFQRRGTQAHFSTEVVTLPAGTRVDSYMLHFDPGASTQSRLGGVRFERPILGIIARADQLRATNEILGAPGTRYHYDNASAKGCTLAISSCPGSTRSNRERLPPTRSRSSGHTTMGCFTPARSRVWSVSTFADRPIGRRTRCCT